MNKKIVILLVLFSISGLFVLSRYWFNGSSIYESENLSIEQIVIKSIDIRYKGGDKDELDKIFTPDFIKKIHSNPNFYNKKIFYIFDKNFMKSFKYIDENQAMVSIRIEDLSGSYIQVVTLTKDLNNKYLISEIEFDI